MSAAGDAGQARTVAVRSPSVWRETGYVARAVLHVVFWSAALMGASLVRSGADPKAAQATVALDEISFSSLDEGSQRLFRQCSDALSEAEDTRSKSGSWPTVAQLAGRNLAPFVDPLDKAGYRWTVLAAGAVVDYLGVPDAASGRPTFLINIVEPEPGTPIDPAAVVDETHHKLRDGTMVHVAIWTVPGAKQLDTAVPTPAFEDGWRRITLTTK